MPDSVVMIGDVGVVDLVYRECGGNGAVLWGAVGWR